MFRVTLAATAVLISLAACSDDSSAPAATVAATADAASGSGAAATVISPAEGKELLESGTELTLIDVRTPVEFAEGHIEGAVNSDIEGGAFSAFIADLDKDTTYVVYCRSGRRSALAAQAMVSAGFTHVYDLGGIVDWQAAGYPVVQ